MTTIEDITIPTLTHTNQHGNTLTLPDLSPHPGYTCAITKHQNQENHTLHLRDEYGHDVETRGIGVNGRIEPENTLEVAQKTYINYFLPHLQNPPKVTGVYLPA